MSFPESFFEQLRERIPVSEIVGRTVALKKRGREFYGLCPFHQEKSPSFTVNDSKGFYHCFGCGAHGDAIGFLVEKQGMHFLDAIAHLAERAGIPMPQITREEKQQREKQQSLYDVMEMATRWFQEQLQSSAGHEARGYLEKRGVSKETIQHFRLGFSPDSREALKKYLRAQGVEEEAQRAVGLIIQPEEGGRESYDRFRDRIMFPITDRRGRVIAFGGRVMKDIQPKYLNSPETELFHKGGVLYNEATARAASDGTVLVAEGYMDVIMLAQAGFLYAVAPLGTAVTEEHLDRLWKIAPEPMMCLDGDQAGIRAMQRVADLALPRVQPGQSLQFVQLPAGEDPDSFLRAKGKAALEKLFAHPITLSDVIWHKESSLTELRTPEQKAGLKKRLDARVALIRDVEVQKQYRNFFFEKLRELRAPFTPAAGRAAHSAKPWEKAGAMDREKKITWLSSVPVIDKNTREGAESILLMTIANNPILLETPEIYEEFLHCVWSNATLDHCCHKIIDHHTEHPNAHDATALCAYLRADPELAHFIDFMQRVEAGAFCRGPVAREEAERGFKLTRLELHAQCLNEERLAAYRSGNETLAQELSQHIAQIDVKTRELIAGLDD